MALLLIINKPRKITAAGWREAEDKVDRLLKRNPDAVYEVWIDEKLAYRVSQQPEKKPKGLYR